MKSHPRIRRTVKWAGTVALALWICNGWIAASWVAPFDRAFFDINNPTSQRSFNPISAVSVRGGCVVIYGALGAFDGVWYEGWSFSSDPFEINWRIGRVHYPDCDAWLVPLWIVVLPISCASVLVWCTDLLASRARRRERAGKCAGCNYDRIGLPAGAPCPECGRVV